MENAKLIRTLEKFDGKLPVMCQCDHGQWPETVVCVQTFYRPKNFDPSEVEYGELEELLEDYDEDELELFIMIN